MPRREQKIIVERVFLSNKCDREALTKIYQIFEDSAIRTLTAQGKDIAKEMRGERSEQP